MVDQVPTVLALDFDGVVCDGLKEYFLTAWRAYCSLWQPEETAPTEGIAEQFYRLRPVVETGWEMPLVLRALQLGETEAAILQNWGAIAQGMVQQEHLEPAKLVAEVDGIRDRWIATDLDSWLAEHRFYPGIIERLRSLLSSPISVVIISTKEGRFIQQLLQRQGVDLTHLRIFGKESQRPKHQVLRELMAEFGDSACFWFVEDRLKTLQSIQKQPDLMDVKLFLADWGYNTFPERQTAASDPAIHLISLQQFSQDFPAWVENLM